MTREEEISKAIDDFLNKEDLTCLSCSAYSFKKGAEWADKHSKSPWISVKDDLPCNHKELINTEYPWFTKETITVSKDGEISTKIMIKDSLGDWKFISNVVEDVVYWMPIPELPKD